MLGFEHHEDAEQFLEAFRERLAKFGLELNPDKTRLIEFGRTLKRTVENGVRESRRPSTSWVSRTTIQEGPLYVWRKTAGKRMRAKLQQLKQELRRRMHRPLVQVGEWLRRVQRGYYQYHAVPGNSATLGRFRHRLFWVWLKIIGHRGGRRMRWDRYCSMFDRWVPYPRIVHPYPSVRFDATHPM